MKLATTCTFLLAFLPLISCSTDETSPNAIQNIEPQKTIRCEHYDLTCVKKAKSRGLKEIPEECLGIKQCKSEDSACFVVWNNETISHDGEKHKSGYNVRKMGCISNERWVCSDDNSCLANGNGMDNHGQYFCCCRSDLCNSHFEYVPQLLNQNEIKDLNDPKIEEKERKKSPLGTLLIAVIVLAILVIFIVVALLIWRWSKKSASNFDAVPPTDPENVLDNPMGHLTASNLAQHVQGGPKDVALSHTIGKGKYGEVWKCTIRGGSVEIALKIFKPQGKQSWQAETGIYNLPQMSNHDNILKYLFHETRKENLDHEFWLATEFQGKGSLHDFLKGNTVTWDELCKIALSIGQGLTFLHEEIPGNGSVGLKPAIAHRDFKSKNVLIKNDMTACIGDFGLAIVFWPNVPIGDTHGQVGTLRYMAPEVLEGAINFSRDAFLRIDMYACALVLWELASRCKTEQNVVTSADPYKLPFEEEANNPPLEKMKDLVVREKARPKIKDSWQLHEGMQALCETIVECWDHDAEARLSASCVVERVRYFRSRVPLNNPAVERINIDSGVGSTASTNGDTDNNSSIGGDDLMGGGRGMEGLGSNATEMTPLYIRNTQN